MAHISQIRGALLEEAILFLLDNIGYTTYDPANIEPHQQSYLRKGAAGLDVRGRGTWHQLDAFALWGHSPAFMYPLNLMIEAKCYSAGRPVGLEVPRNSVGVLKDIAENYFTYNKPGGGSVQGPRHNYTAAIFSASGFTQPAVEYAIAHQVFLIQYQNVTAIQPLIDCIRAFDEECIDAASKKSVAAARSYLRSRFHRPSADQRDPPQPHDDPPELTDKGKQLLSESVTNATRAIRGSYFGMLQGQWPLHLLRTEPLPPEAFTKDEVLCEVYVNDQGNVQFEPREFPRGRDPWFKLEFSLPRLIVELVQESWLGPDGRANVAELKRQHFSYIDLSGVIGGIRRSVRLTLDGTWIEAYLGRS
jgi:hypothetical protein